MDRTVPSRANDEIDLYIRTYYSLLRSSHDVRIRTLVEAHLRTNSALHVHAKEQMPDMAAFIYAVLRIPACMITSADRVVMGQSADNFAKHGFPDLEKWQRVGQPARRRPSFWDGDKTIAVYITSRSDIDDLIPILTAYQIERDKLYLAFNQTAIRKQLKSARSKGLDESGVSELAAKSGVPLDDLQRLQRIWRDDFVTNLLDIASRRIDLSVRLLGGSFMDYNRATHRWWVNLRQRLPQTVFEEKQIYFVSSNSHSLPNLVSGYALHEQQRISEYILASGDSRLRQEYEDIVRKNVPSNRQNFLYYVLKKLEAEDPQIVDEREEFERRAGIVRATSKAEYDVEAQIIDINRINPESMDSRLQLPGFDLLRKSDALIINIDFPLGMAAYHILSQIGRNTNNVLGVYITGKAATLNGRIGDVMIPAVVHDEQSDNTFLYQNCFTADDVAPHLTYGSVLDNQKAITVRGTFLQNENYMAVFYKEGYTILEMEAGPYLSAVYEMTRPQRYPRNEIVDLHSTSFPVGILHYASDTPFSKGKNLGAQNLSYFGMDPTYATLVAILRHVFQAEIDRQNEALMVAAVR